MIDAGIDDGDLIIIRRQSTADNGQIVLAIVDNETIKNDNPPDDGSIAADACAGRREWGRR